MIALSYNNSKKVMIFPVVLTDSYNIGRVNNHQTFETIQDGEIQITGPMGLREVVITNFFPLERASYVEPYAKLLGWDCVEFIEEFEKLELPPWLIITDVRGKTIFNMPCKVTAFDYKPDKIGDIQYTLTLKEDKL